NCGVVLALTQTGSALILIGSFFGAVPSSITIPLMSPAVAVSTFWPAGVAAGDDGGAEVLELPPPPPHATTDAASARPSVPTHMFRRRIEVSSREKVLKNGTKSTFHHTLSLRLTRPGRAGFAQLSLDTILDPVRIPPFDRGHRMAVNEHREVQMIAAGE